jgi:hypothetical protein
MPCKKEAHALFLSPDNCHSNAKSLPHAGGMLFSGASHPWATRHAIWGRHDGGVHLASRSSFPSTAQRATPALLLTCVLSYVMVKAAQRPTKYTASVVWLDWTSWSCVISISALSHHARLPKARKEPQNWKRWNPAIPDTLGLQDSLAPGLSQAQPSRLDGA